MKKLTWKKVGIRSKNGVWRFESAGEENLVRFRWQKIPNGWACYVSAVCPDGFDADAGILLVPDVKEESIYLAIENHSPFWCRPVFGKAFSALPERVQELFVKNGERYTCYLPICDSVFKTVICGCEDGLAFRLYTNDSHVTECAEQLAFLFSEGTDPLKLARICAEQAAVLLNNGLTLRERKQVNEVFDYLGWCSWNAMMIRVSRDGLLKKAREFRDKGVPIRYAIIDDMWAEIPGLNAVPLDGEMVNAMHQSKLKKFEGDPERFPDGMRGAIEALKRAGIPKVGVWFPVTGYWAGFDPNGEEAQNHRAELMTVGCGTFLADTPTLTPKPEEASARRLYDDFCGRVKAWGGDFVKFDNQGCHRIYRDVVPIGQGAGAIAHAIDAAAEKYFDGALINCMGMPSECMFGRTSTVSRCSDDFVPESREWFTKNILQCAYNGLLQGQFYVNDWDMWWTDDGQAQKNSLCRAISGGPIYVSDMQGRTNPERLRPLCLSDGRILRPDESATPTGDCLTDDPRKSGKPFKVRNTANRVGLLTAFNLDAENEAVSGSIGASDVGFPPDTRVLVYDWFSKTCCLPEVGERLPVTLKDADDYRFWWLIPYDGGEPVMLGRTDLFVGCLAPKRVGTREWDIPFGGEVSVVSDRTIWLKRNGVSVAGTRNGLVHRFVLPKSEETVRVTVEC